MKPARKWGVDDGPSVLAEPPESHVRRMEALVRQWRAQEEEARARLRESWRLLEQARRIKGSMQPPP